MRELAVVEGSRTGVAGPIVVGADIPPVPSGLLRAVETLWTWSVQAARQVPEEGMAAFEKEFRERLFKIGARFIEEAIPVGIGTGYIGSIVGCGSCGRKSRFVNHRPKVMTTLVTEVRLRRAYYHCASCGNGRVPLDETLSIVATSFSPAVRELTSLVNAEVSFARGSHLLERMSGIRLHKEEGRRIAEELGRELERKTVEEVENAFQPKKPSPRENSEPARRLYVSPDGTTVPTVDGWKEVKVGAVFTATVPRAGEDPERERTRYVGLLGAAEPFYRRLYIEMQKQGLTDNTEVIVIGDGAHWIWNEAELGFPKNRVEIIDFYHASEKLWGVTRAVFGEESKNGKRWAEKWSSKLKRGDANRVIAAMTRLKPKTEEGRKIVRETLGYFKSNRKRMRYREFRRCGLFIGSGVVEGSCKHLVGDRLKHGGMHWTEEGAQAILNLRLALLNQRWDHLWLN